MGLNPLCNEEAIVFDVKKKFKTFKFIFLYKKEEA
jgi:hypothetical protein